MLPVELAFLLLYVFSVKKLNSLPRMWREEEGGDDIVNVQKSNKKKLLLQK
jgi:hypothetical protein